MKCYKCEDNSFVFYDFLVIEDSTVSDFSETIRKTQRVAGIARIPVCANCLKNELKKRINANIKKNGKPKLFSGNYIRECNELLSQLNAGTFNKNAELRSLVSNALKQDIAPMVSIGSLPICFDDDELKQVKSDYSLLSLDAQYTQVVYRNSQTEYSKPFSCPISKKLIIGSMYGNLIPTKFQFYFMDDIDIFYEPQNHHLLTEIKEVLPEIKRIYSSIV